MDRGRRGSVGIWQNGKDSPKGSAKKYGGDMVAPNMPASNAGSIGIDPNLLVGPLYVPQTTKADKIKEQMGDITAKLHNTLYKYDEYDELEEQEDPLMRVMRNQIGGLSDKEMQSKLNGFMDRYEVMHVQVSEANKDRDEMLLQLADWFTTDHVDLDDIKSSMDDTDEESIKQGYFDTITNFEKIKKIQTQITSASGEGKSTKQLQHLKQELEKDVVDKFKVMKNMSMQTMKLKVADDLAPWKYAAQEIVDMLKNVRAESADDMGAISKKMQVMIDQLERQALLVKSLTTELRDKSEVCKKLINENSDLSQDVMMLRARHRKYEKDLESAKQMIRKLHQEKRADSDEKPGVLAVPGKSMVESISKVLAVFEEPKLEVKKMGSDPALLRSQLRDYQDALDSIRAEYSRAADEVDELKTNLEEKKVYINNMEAENEKLTKNIRKMRQELRQEHRQSIAAGVIAPAAGDGHKCEHCNCHVPEKDVDEEFEGMKTEVKKWQDKVTYFKKLLADTEMKLSDAFKEISAIRMMDRDVTPTPVQPSDKPKKATEEKSADSDDKVEGKKEKVVARATPKPKPRPPAKARYLESLQKPTSPQLPTIERTPLEQQIEEQLPGDLTAKQSRELKLYKAGDLQGKLNLLVSDVMEFVTEIGKMLYTEKDDEGGKFQSMKTQKQSALKDPREEEARQNKSQVMFSGQHACAKLREAYELLSHILSPKHDEYEALYRSFKMSQQRNAIRREVMRGRMNMSVLRDFDKQVQRNADQESLLHVYFNISYGGGGASMLYKPATGRQYAVGMSRKTSSTYSVNSQESEAKLKHTTNVLGFQRSKSNLDTHDSAGFREGNLFGEGFQRDGASVTTNTPTEQFHRESTMSGNKQELRIGMAGVPKKGLIHLSTNDADTRLPVDDFALHVERRRSSSQPEYAVGASTKHKSLIRHKDILTHINAGMAQLEEEEAQKLEEEQLNKSLGDYTILDLQSKLLEMTDAKSIRRQSQTPVGMAETQQVAGNRRRRQEQQAKTDKPITLPAIKNFNPFGAMKTK